MEILSREALEWAYRLFLDREPEDNEVVESRLLSLKTYEELRFHFMHSLEFKQKMARSSEVSEEGGFPLPPPELMKLVSGTTHPVWYLAGGRLAAASIETALEDSSRSIESFHSILDFGCGCGRVIRHWADLTGPSIYGVDYNPELISWCEKNLTFAHFSANGLAPPLEFADSTFDFVYALSVFTHLPEDLQRSWIEEIARVLEPGGILLITVHGRYYLDHLLEEDQKRFLQGELVVRDEELAGSNICGAYHPAGYLRQGVFAELFELLDHLEQGAKGNPCQDLVLFRKRN